MFSLCVAQLIQYNFVSFYEICFNQWKIFKLLQEKASAVLQKVMMKIRFY